MIFKSRWLTIIALALLANLSFSQKYTHQDTLRGSIGEGRKKWEVLKYEITVEPDISRQTISGKNLITLVDSGISRIQIDLQEPMVLDKAIYKNQSCSFSREGNVYWLEIQSPQSKSPTVNKLELTYHGAPRKAVNPPWDGGWIWRKDKQGKPWISVACQGLGASVWYPCKDVQSDEPNNGAILNIIVPDTLMAVGNGRLSNETSLPGKRKMLSWEVKNPINNYNIIPYIGDYVHFGEKFDGLKGKLDMDYWVLRENLETAKTHFKDAPKMMEAFEWWFGPYPFYEDGYKLVDAPHLGMEHQSAIAYGNQYKKGYLGGDRSFTGWGLEWDYIIVHESGHEWFANNITTADIADMWVHEGFTDYSEALYTEYYHGKKAATDYVEGLRSGIYNFNPIIAHYGVNEEGDGDMYNKGANLLHSIRTIIDNDSLFRNILIGLNKDFYHQIVNTSMIEQYISQKAGFNFSSIFDQYLRGTRIPALEYKQEGNKLIYRWTVANDTLQMPIRIKIDNETTWQWIRPSKSWQKLDLKNPTDNNTLQIDRNFYVFLRKKIKS